MKKRELKLLRFVTCLSAVITLSLGFSAFSYAGHWMADNTGYWYVHDDGTYPSYSWEWIDNDGDGIYQCYAFDENGYLYTNTLTPDGYLVGADGAWYENSVPVTRAFIHNATVAPTQIGNHNTTDYAYTVDGVQLVTKKYSNAKNKTTTGSTSKSSSKTSTSKSSSSSSGSSSKNSSGTIQISSSVSSSDIVNSKYVSKKTTTASDSGSTATDTDDDNTTKTTGTSSEPDVSNTSYDSFGPGANIPSSYSAETITPTAYIKDASPKSGKVIERDGYEDADQSDDEEDEDEEE